MDPVKNKRVLLGACHALGIRASDCDAPSELLDRLLFRPSIGTPFEDTDAPVIDAPDELTFRIGEEKKLKAVGMSNAVVAKEVQQRWHFLKSSIVNESTFAVPHDLVPEQMDQLKTDGWQLVLSDNESMYFKQTSSIETTDDKPIEAIGSTMRDKTDAASEPLNDDTDADDAAVMVDAKVIRERVKNWLALCPAFTNPHADASSMAWAIIPTNAYFGTIPCTLTLAEKQAACAMWDKHIKPDTAKRSAVLDESDDHSDDHKRAKLSANAEQGDDAGDDAITHDARPSVPPPLYRSDALS